MNCQNVRKLKGTRVRHCLREAQTVWQGTPMCRHCRGARLREQARQDRQRKINQGMAMSMRRQTKEDVLENVAKVRQRIRDFDGKLMVAVCGKCARILFEVTLPISIDENTRRTKEFRAAHGEVSKCCKVAILLPLEKTLAGIEAAHAPTAGKAGGAP